MRLIPTRLWACVPMPPIRRSARPTADSSSATTPITTRVTRTPRAERDAREAAAEALGRRATDEELGYVTTDDSFSKILADARDKLEEFVSDRARRTRER